MVRKTAVAAAAQWQEDDGEDEDDEEEQGGERIRISGKKNSMHVISLVAYLCSSRMWPFASKMGTH